jgi:prepilin-type processing-associated H-X9-DG protein
MHGHHDALGRLPWGSNWNPRTSWVCPLWPYIEQTALAGQYNYTVGFWQAPNGGPTSSTANLVCAQVPIYFCPSDRATPAYWKGDPYYRSRGNYVVNWGNAYYDTPPPSGLAPFYHMNGNRSTPGVVTLVAITDGTSNTLMMSETLMAQSHDDNDWRGDIQNDDGVFKFMTLTTPNTSAPDVVNWAIANGDPYMPVNTAGSQYSAARSRHTSGVNVALCDGSIRFVSNSIPLQAWKWLGTMNGGEVIPNY